MRGVEFRDGHELNSIARSVFPKQSRLREAVIFRPRTAFFWSRCPQNDAHKHSGKEKPGSEHLPHTCTCPIGMTNIKGVLPRLLPMESLVTPLLGEVDHRVATPGSTCRRACAPIWDGGEQSVAEGMRLGKTPHKFFGHCFKDVPVPLIAHQHISQTQPDQGLGYKRDTTTEINEHHSYQDTNHTLKTRRANRRRTRGIPLMTFLSHNSSIYNSLSRYVRQLCRTYHSSIPPDARNLFDRNLKGNR